MKIYWDSSAILNALCSRAVYDRLDASDNTSRSHSLVEVFSHLTGRGLPMKNGQRHRVSPQDAAKMISALAKHLSLEDLSADESLATIEIAGERGIQGARIHDLLHAHAAKTSGAKKILTRDKGFQSLGEGMPTEWP